MKKISLLSFIVLCFLALELSAGVKITMKVSDIEEPMVMLVGKDKLKTSISNAGKMDMIFDSKSKTMYMINHDDQEYFKIDKENNIKIDKDKLPPDLPLQYMAKLKNGEEVEKKGNISLIR